MFSFTMTYSDDSQTLIARNAHLRGEAFGTIVADAKTGLVSSLTDLDLDDLVAAGILAPAGEGFKIARLTDGSPDAQAVAWGRLVKNQFCSCDVEPSVSEWQRYEKHDARGEYTGAHGFACPHCCGIVQVG